MSDKLRNLIQAPPRQLRGNLAAATSVEPSASASEIIRVAGASSIRVRGQFSKAGVLRVELVRHNATTQTMRNDDDDDDVGAASVGQAGGVVTRGEWS